MYYDNHYTELANLRENAYRSFALAVVVLILSRSAYAYLIALIELGLIGANFYIADNWDLRDTIFVSVHYSSLQLAAYFAELAIIGLAGIFGAAMVGTDDDSNSDRRVPRWFSRHHRMLRR